MVARCCRVSYSSFEGKVADPETGLHAAEEVGPAPDSLPRCAARHGLLRLVQAVLVVAFTFLLLADLFVGVTDWPSWIIAMILAIVLIVQVLPPFFAYIVAFHMAVLGVVIHLSYVDEAYVILWQIVSNALWICSIANAVAFARTSRVCCNAGAWLPRRPPCMKKACSPCEGRCKALGCCLSYCLLLVLCVMLLLVLALAVLFVSTESLAAVDSYDASMVLPEAALLAGRKPPMQVGTVENMQLNGTGVEGELTGIWWIRGQDEPLPGYSAMHLEELVSFEGLSPNYANTSEDPPSGFPLKLGIQSGAAGRWAWSNTIGGRFQQMVSWGDASSVFSMLALNRTHWVLSYKDNVEWLFQKQNDDEWLRIIRQDCNLRPGRCEFSYTLTRILYADGRPHPQYYDAFVKYMGRVKLRVFNTNSLACRNCGKLPFGTSTVCSAACR